MEILTVYRKSECFRKYNLPKSIKYHYDFPYIPIRLKSWFFFFFLSIQIIHFYVQFFFFYQHYLFFLKIVNSTTARDTIVRCFRIKKTLFHNVSRDVCKNELRVGRAFYPTHTQL